MNTSLEIENNYKTLLKILILQMNLNLNALKLGMLIEAMFLSLTQKQKNSVPFCLGVGFHSINID